MNDFLSSCEKYDFKTKKWENIESMKNPRSKFSAFTANGLIYVFGGFKDENITTLPNFEVYHPLENKWEDLKVSKPMIFNQICEALCIPVPNTYKVLIIGGSDGKKGAQNGIFEFDIVTNKITKSKNAQLHT